MEVTARRRRRPGPHGAADTGRPGRVRRPGPPERREGLVAARSADRAPSAPNWSRPWPWSSACSPRGWSRSTRSIRPAPRPPSAWTPTSPRSTSGSTRGSTSTVRSPSTSGDMVEPEGLLLLARLDGRPIGCGALHFFPDGVADLKRMWVDPLGPRAGAGPAAAHRAGGRGPGPRRRRLLRLETNRRLVEAIAMYHAIGFDRGRPLQRRGPRPPLVRQTPVLTAAVSAAAHRLTVWLRVDDGSRGRPPARRHRGV